MFTPADHFFIGLGPTYRRELAQWVEGERTGEGMTQSAFGVLSTLGGYF